MAFNVERMAIAKDAIRIKKRNKDLSWKAISEIIKTDYEYLRRCIRDYKIQESRETSIIIDRQELATLPRFDYPPHLYPDKKTIVFIRGDDHCSKIHWLFSDIYNQTMAWYKTKGYKVFSVHCGDLLDASALSRHAKIRPQTTMKIDRHIAKSLLESECKIADRIILLRGNHDDWLSRILDGILEPSDYWQLILSGLDVNKIDAIDDTKVVIHSGDLIYRATHAIQYSVNTGKIARELTKKFDCSVISHHEHHTANGRCDYNRHWWIANGCMADDIFWEYVHGYDTKNNNMKNSFVVLYDGQYKIYTPYLGGQNYKAFGIDASELYEYENKKQLVREGKLDLAQLDLPLE